MTMLQKTMFALVVLALMPVQAAWAEHSEIGQKAANRFIIPAYENLATTAASQVETMQALCDQADASHLVAAQDQFAALVSAWSRAEIIRFGPILAENRIDRILFWPDRRGIALRQIQALLAEQDETALDLENLRQKSVALQGLGSLEFVLFGTGADEMTTPDTYRCALGVTIAQAIKGTAGEVLAAWQKPDGIAAHMADPQPEYADYRDKDEVLREVLGIFIHGFEMIRDVRLGPIVETETSTPNPNVAIYRRSQQTIESMTASIAGMKDLFLVSGMEEELPEELRWVAGALDFEFQNFTGTAASVAELPIADAVADEEASGKIGYLRILTQSLQQMAVQEISFSLGLSAGFSSLDGD